MYVESTSKGFGEESLEVYSALVYVLKQDQEHPRHDFRVMEVNDRFQFCRLAFKFM